MLNYLDLKNKIDAEWDKPAHSKTDWLGLERTIKDILTIVRDSSVGLENGGGEVSEREALLLIDEAMGAFLRRGTVFN